MKNLILLLILQISSSFNTRLPDNSTETIFWDGLSNSDILNLVHKAELDLKIFIYPIPEVSMNLTRDHIKNIDLTHFMSEFIFIDYLKRISKLNTSSLTHMVVSDPSQANIFIIEHEWMKVARTKCKLLFDFYLKPIIDNVVDNYVYYNRSKGLDHFFFAVYDKGPFCDPACDNGTNKAILKRIINASFIGNYGMDRKTFENNTLVMFNKNYIITNECHRSGYDIVIPQLMKPKSVKFFYTFNQTRYPNRIHDSSFSGSDWYDRWPFKYMCKSSDFDYNRSLEYFECHLDGMTKTKLLYHGYFVYMPCGFACWSQRLYEALAHYSIPILINDGAIQPFEKFIDWTKFTVKMNRYTWFNTLMRNDYRKNLRIESDKFKTYYKNCLISNNLPINEAEDLTTYQKNDTYNNIWLHSNNTPCINLFNSFIYNKTFYIKQAVEWFNFLDLMNSSINAFKLLELELWCRVYKFYNFQSKYNDSLSLIYFNQMIHLCNRPSDYTGRKEYFY